ncbi:MAG TPA: lectin-like protein [Pirellulales bacterium]
MSEFDPYRKWLGISAPARPPHHYQLLGLEAFESDPETISNAADRQMAHLRTFQSGPHSALSQKLLNECSAARICLLQVDQKTEYDATLRRQLAHEQLVPAANATVPAPIPLRPATSAGGPQPQPVAVAQPPVSFTGRLPSVSHRLRPRRRQRVTAIAVIGALAAVTLAVLLAWLATSDQPNRQRHLSASYAPSAVTVRTDRDGVGRPVASKPPKPERQRAPSADGPHDRLSDDPTDAVADTASQQPSGERRTPPPSDIGVSARDEAPAPPSRERSTEKASDGPRRTTLGDLLTTDPPATPDPEPEPTPTPKPRPRRAKKPTQPRRPRLVPDDAVAREGQWYWFSSVKVSAADALQHADQLKGRLVTISSAAENDFIAANAKGPTWIGMHKVNGIWLNSTGREQQYFNWDRGQPSSGRKEVFAAVRRNGVWHDYLDDKLFYCIEWGKE